MQDKDSEEDYHALNMARAITAAGYGYRVIHGLDELSWNESGQVIDGEGRVLKCVWKTWAWETALEQLRQESENDRTYSALPIRTGHPRHENDVRLIDVLLRPEIRVFEPLWTVIPGNKAILPILWSLFPHHPYLLDTEFELSDELRRTGYAVKPIAGRCGSNIGLVDHRDEVLDETCGRFGEQENVYQQLWCLPKVAGHGHHRAQHLVHRDFLQVVNHQPANDPGNQRPEETGAEAVADPGADGAGGQRRAVGDGVADIGRQKWHH